jgi:ClpP class serine protease
MPLYTYEHPKTKKTIDVIQGMNELHEYTDKKGVKWNRIFSKPQATTNTQISANASEVEFYQKTAGKKLTVGDVWDMAGEASNKRADKEGKDFKKEKTIKDYAKKCNGALHPQA